MFTNFCYRFSFVVHHNRLHSHHSGSLSPFSPYAHGRFLLDLFGGARWRKELVGSVEVIADAIPQRVRTRLEMLVSNASAGRSTLTCILKVACILNA